MDAVIFNLGIFGLYFVQFLSFILYFDTDSHRLIIFVLNFLSKVSKAGKSSCGDLVGVTLPYLQ